MNFIQSFLIANIYSEVITEYLGIFALLAFGLTVGGVFIILTRDIVSKQSNDIRRFESESSVRKAKEDAEIRFRNELAVFEKNCDTLFNVTIESSRIRLRDLVGHARSALSEIDGYYAGVCKSVSGESSDEARGRYARACQAQWLFLKQDLGFIGFKELEPYLYKALDSSVLDVPSANASEDVMDEVNARGVEVRLLHQSIPFEKFGLFYHDYLSAIDGYKSYFSMHMKEWFGRMNVEIVKMIRFKTSAGVTIDDTDYKAKFVRLKNILDIVDKLSERLESNSSEIGDEDAAFMQVLFGGVVLGIISDLPAWFLEIGDLCVENVERDSQSRRPLSI